MALFGSIFGKGLLGGVQITHDPVTSSYRINDLLTNTQMSLREEDLLQNIPNQYKFNQFINCLIEKNRRKISMMYNVSGAHSGYSDFNQRMQREEDLRREGRDSVTLDQVITRFGHQAILEALVENAKQDVRERY